MDMCMYIHAPQYFAGVKYIIPIQRDPLDLRLLMMGQCLQVQVDSELHNIMLNVA